MTAARFAYRIACAMKLTQWIAAAMLLGLSLPAIAQAEQPQPDQKKTERKGPARMSVSPGVAEGLKTHDEAPVYPVEAKAKGIRGNVVLKATIDTTGKMSELKLIEGDPVLAKAAIEAVKKWRYRPYLLDGKPVTVETTITVRFVLGNSHS
jgi:TonB family protein